MQQGPYLTSLVCQMNPTSSSLTSILPILTHPPALPHAPHLVGVQRTTKGQWELGVAPVGCAPEARGVVELQSDVKREGRGGRLGGDEGEGVHLQEGGVHVQVDLCRKGCRRGGVQLRRARGGRVTVMKEMKGGLTPAKLHVCPGRFAWEGKQMGCDDEATTIVNSCATLSSHLP